MNVNRKTKITSAVIALLLWAWMVTMSGIELAAYGAFVIFTWITATVIAAAVFHEKK